MSRLSHSGTCGSHTSWVPPAPASHTADAPASVPRQESRHRLGVGPPGRDGRLRPSKALRASYRPTSGKTAHPRRLPRRAQEDPRVQGKGPHGVDGGGPDAAPQPVPPDSCSAPRWGAERGPEASSQVLGAPAGPEPGRSPLLQVSPTTPLHLWLLCLLAAGSPSEAVTSAPGCSGSVCVGCCWGCHECWGSGAVKAPRGQRAVGRALCGPQGQGRRKGFGPLWLLSF